MLNKSEFLISGIETGKLNAMVKNIMVQTGITEPEEVVRSVNAGELQISVIKPKWTEKDGIIYLDEELISDGTTGEEWLVRLKKGNIKITSYAKSILLSPEFKPTNGTKYKVAVLKGEFFSDNDRITKNIRKEAKKRKLSVPNTEVACLIREKFFDKDLEAMGLYWIVAMHEPIKDFDGDPLLLNAFRNDDGSWLGTDYVNPDVKWYRGGGFAFVASSQEVSGS